MVTLGQTTSITSEKRASPRSATLLRMLQAAIIPITVVFPVPVAILQAWRRNARIPSAFASSPGSSSGTSIPCSSSFGIR